MSEKGIIFKDMTDTNSNQNVQQVLANYGFRFAGNDENGQPLLTAPNGQIVTYKIAIDFINQQEKIRQQNQAVSQGPESMNNTSIETIASPEVAVERAQEQEKSIEQQPNTQVNTVQPAAKLAVAPRVAAKPKEVPFGDGYTPKSFDPSSLESTRNFVTKNASKSDNLSNKWLAIQFQKFIEQYEEKLKK